MQPALSVLLGRPGNALARRVRDLAGDLRDRSTPPASPRPPEEPEYRLLFVCLGNICRSPTAQAVLNAKLAVRGLLGRVAVESAGTGALPGCRPHHLARSIARRHGLRLDVRARRFSPDDFDAFDSIVVFDRANEESVLAVARCDDDRRKVTLIADEEIADPMGGGASEFARAYEAIAAACERLVDEVDSALAAGRVRVRR